MLGRVGLGRGEAPLPSRLTAYGSTALVAESGPGRQVVAAGAAGRAQARPAAQAEVRPGRVLVLALETLHRGASKQPGQRRSERRAQSNPSGLPWSRTLPRVAARPEASSVVRVRGGLIHTFTG